MSFTDGSVIAQLSSPDMRTPIALALTWPHRMTTPTARLDLVKLGTLSFEAPDEDRFPALRLAREALTAGGTAPAVLNAANEVAVEAFLGRRIGFTDIARVVAAVSGIGTGARPAGSAGGPCRRIARGRARRALWHALCLILMCRASATTPHDRGNVAETGTEMDAIAAYMLEITACRAAQSVLRSARPRLGATREGAKC